MVSLLIYKQGINGIIIIIIIKYNIFTYKNKNKTLQKIEPVPKAKTTKLNSKF